MAKWKKNATRAPGEGYERYAASETCPSGTSMQTVSVLEEGTT